MYLSEILRLGNCFAGGIDVSTVAEIGQCSSAVVPSVPAPGIIMGLTSVPAPVLSTEPCQGGDNASGKEVVVAGGKKVDGSQAGKEVANAKKQYVAVRSPKEAPSSKYCKLVPSGLSCLW